MWLVVFRANNIKKYHSHCRMSNINEIYENLELHLKKHKKDNKDKLHNKHNRDNKDNREKLPEESKKMLFVDSLSNSRFRQNKFQYKSDGPVPYFNVLEGQKVKFSNLCLLLCDYIVNNSLYLDNGLIKCDDFLRSFCGKDTVSFIWLVSQFRRILI